MPRTTSSTHKLIPSLIVDWNMKRENTRKERKANWVLESSLSYVVG